MKRTMVLALTLIVALGGAFALNTVRAQGGLYEESCDAHEVMTDFGVCINADAHPDVLAGGFPEGACDDHEVRYQDTCVNQDAIEPTPEPTEEPSGDTLFACVQQHDGSIMLLEITQEELATYRELNPQNTAYETTPDADCGSDEPIDNTDEGATTEFVTVCTAANESSAGPFADEAPYYIQVEMARSEYERRTNEGGDLWILDVACPATTFGEVRGAGGGESSTEASSSDEPTTADSNGASTGTEGGSVTLPKTGIRPLSSNASQGQAIAALLLALLLFGCGYRVLRAKTE